MCSFIYENIYVTLYNKTNKQKNILRRLDRAEDGMCYSSHNNVDVVSMACVWDSAAPLTRYSNRSWAQCGK